MNTYGIHLYILKRNFFSLSKKSDFIWSKSQQYLNKVVKNDRTPL